MIGTPAEVFSLQQIKIFQAGNTLISNMIPEISNDSSLKRFGIAPTHLIYDLLGDSSLHDWQKSFLEKYNITELTYEQRIKSKNSFLQTMKEMDSLVNVCSDIHSETDSTVTISQKLDIKLMYQDSAPDDIDNIFTTADNKKPRLDFITVNDNMQILITDEEQVASIKIGIENYSLMLILPINKSLKQYMSEFSEEKYLSFINRLQERKVNVSFPLFSLEDTIHNIPLPQYELSDTTINFPKQLDIILSFNLTKATQADLNTHSKSDFDVLKSSNNETLKYASPFLFFIRENNSNIILFSGFYGGE